jgi:RNase adaptor protein for sRNA GlmZ degradation
MIEKRPHFLESIPFALSNLKDLLQNKPILSSFEHLNYVLQQLVEIDLFKPLVYPEFTVTVSSFSFKKGIPEDKTGNGGGFVFDCRGIHNPGRYKEFKLKTGRDAEVIEFFKDNSDIDDFVENVINTITPTVKEYIARDFNSLMISFGCTGGQHRSVYCADKIAEYLKTNFNIKIKLIHREMGWDE